ncbi:hypothetical protein JAAARDRAFT_189679 [Jaapia argillacea MUCL 33604]|uniref:DRBM domain-containing protein n=1 Tax=Jaapia argillacea MUCL 33604 TaxID=933084 RepID=A0A067QIB7_9AGAM|nr:hypothetical protein JAAARDRAFT_189679 [Jaapia argillacea MUCL 33604]
MLVLLGNTPKTWTRLRCITLQCNKHCSLEPHYKVYHIFRYLTKKTALSNSPKLTISALKDHHKCLQSVRIYLTTTSLLVLNPVTHPTKSHLPGQTTNCTLLNNFLQQRGGSKHNLLEWEEKVVGPQHDPQWTMTALCYGIVYGSATARNKSDAKEEAAGRALAALQE